MSSMDALPPPLPPRRPSQVEPELPSGGNLIIVDAEGTPIPLTIGAAPDVTAGGVADVIGEIGAGAPVVGREAPPLPSRKAHFTEPERAEELNDPTMDEEHPTATAAAADTLSLHSLRSLKTLIPTTSTPLKLTQPGGYLNPQAWLEWLATLQRAEDPEVRELRKEVEKEEIRRYMENFNKHVDHLVLQNPRLKNPMDHMSSSEQASARMPVPRDFLRKKPISAKVDDEGSVAAATVVDQVEGEVVEEVERADEEAKERGEGKAVVGERERELKEGEEVDWFAYWLAKSAYSLNLYLYKTVRPTPKPTPPPEFTVARLKSAGTRLYVASKPPWEAFAVMLGGVVMWDRPRKTMRWMGVYLLLTITSTFLPFFISLAFYHLISPRISKTSQTQMQKEALLYIKREELAEKLSAKWDDDHPTKSSSKHKSGSGHATTDDDDSDSDDNDAGDADDVSLKEKLNIAATNAAKKIKSKGKKKLEKSSVGGRVKMMSAWESFKKEHGAMIVLILNDFADMHEKAVNLYTWKKPEASIKAAIGMSFAIPLTYFTPTWVLVKAIELGIFAVLFFVIPIVARTPVYNPNAWLLGDAPTDAEHAMFLIRKYGLEGKVWASVQPIKKSKKKRPGSISGVSITSTSDGAAGETASIQTENATMLDPEPTAGWTDVGSAETGGLTKTAKWLETGRQFMKGEKRLDLSLVKSRDEWDAVPSDVVSAKRVSMGGLTAGLVLRTKTKESAYTSDSTSYLAQYNGGAGTLFLSKAGVRYSPFLGGKKGKSKTDEAIIDSVDPATGVEYPTGGDDENDGIILPAEGAEPELVENGNELEIPMMEVAGIRKIQRSKLGVTISSGLEIETVSQKTFAFPYVANRDQAFTLLLASSQQAFAAA